MTENEQVNVERVAKKIAKQLSDAGFTVYFAGGCVRDSLVGREAHDYDLVTDATPEQVQTIFPKTDAVGAHFGPPSCTPCTTYPKIALC